MGLLGDGKMGKRGKGKEMVIGRKARRGQEPSF